MKSYRASKKHITNRNVFRLCVAEPGNCPYGNVDVHFDTAEMPRAEQALDALLEELRDRANEVGFAQYRDKPITRFTNTSRSTLTMGMNIKKNIDELKIREQIAKQNLLNFLRDTDTKTYFCTLDDKNVRTTLVGASKSVGIDTEVFDKSPYAKEDKYYSETNVSPYTSFVLPTTVEANYDKFKEEILKDSPPRSYFGLEGEEKERVGKELVQEVLYYKRLHERADKSFKATLTSLSPLRNSLKQFCDDYNLPTSTLGEKYVDIYSMTPTSGGAVILRFADANTRRYLNTAALKEDNLYDQFAVERDRSAYIRMTAK